MNAIHNHPPLPDERVYQRWLEKVGAGMNSATCDGLTEALKEERGAVGEPIKDVVYEASEDSFPASDAPGWTQRNATRRPAEP
jgi:hypothetical protein